MDEKILQNYKNAGKISKEIKDELKKMIRPGTTLLDIAQLVEKRTHEKGGKLAFPPNLSLNDVAAHYTPLHNDTKTVEKGDLLKVDIGVHVNGYISDSAFTYCSEQNELVTAAKEAVDAALEVIKPGVTIEQVSKAIEDSVTNKGLALVKNLTGHGLDYNTFHAEPTVFNIHTNSNYTLSEGQAIAVEPFVVPTSTIVKESAPTEILRYLQDRPVRMMEARKLLEIIKNEFGFFPFAKRYLYKFISPVKLNLAVKQLEDVGAIENYPPLKCPQGQMIAQAEESIIVFEEPIVTSR